LGGSGRAASWLAATGVVGPSDASMGGASAGNASAGGGTSVDGVGVGVGAFGAQKPKSRAFVRSLDSGVGTVTR
jgi:hypothetical protein